MESRGVEFDSINLMADEAAYADLVERGLTTAPVITRGDRHVGGIDLDDIDELLGLGSEKGKRLLPGDELIKRSTRVMDAAARYARQLPPEHYDDDFPGLEGVEPPMVLPDGTHYQREDGSLLIPHRTWLGLVHHIEAHSHLQRGLVTADSRLDPSTIVGYTSYGQPAASVTAPESARQIEEEAERVRAWWTNAPPDTLQRQLQPFFGPKTLHEMLQVNTYSLVQHTRQLMAALHVLGIEPDGAIGDAEYEGLEMPADVWTD